MFKKILTGLVISAIISPAFAAQDAYITFNNGKTAIYKNLPDSVDNAQFNQILIRDHGMSLNDVDSARSRIVEVPNVPEKKEEFCSSTACKVAVGVAVVAVLGYGLSKLSVPAAVNPCVLPTDRARDGSLCGGRASSVRPGGR